MGLGAARVAIENDCAASSCRDRANASKPAILIIACPVVGFTTTGLFSSYQLSDQVNSEAAVGGCVGRERVDRAIRPVQIDVDRAVKSVAFLKNDEGLHIFTRHIVEGPVFGPFDPFQIGHEIHVYVDICLFVDEDGVVSKCEVGDGR